MSKGAQFTQHAHTDMSKLAWSSCFHARLRDGQLIAELGIDDEHPLDLTTCELHAENPSRPGI